MRPGTHDDGDGDAGDGGWIHRVRVCATMWLCVFVCVCVVGERTSVYADREVGGRGGEWNGLSKMPTKIIDSFSSVIWAYKPSDGWPTSGRGSDRCGLSKHSLPSK